MPSGSANDETGGEDQQSIDDMVARFGQLNNPAHDEPDEITAGPSSSRRVENKHASGDVGACVACNEEKRKCDLARGPCSHVYCQDCFQQLLEAAMVDESLFPPRCCRQQFPTSMISPFVSKAFMERLSQRRTELSTPNRTYCAEPSCSTFIPSESVQDEGACCPRCRMKTCTTCKQPAHDGDCPNDESLRSLLQVAQEAGWQRCNQCKRMVELDVGCNHIRCICGAEFCYVCGQRWKTCRCAQWDENRLETRAQGIVGRRPAAANPVVHARQVRQVQQDLRVRHQCQHQSWEYVSGSHRCEECYQTLPRYIFECRQCHIMACNRCRRNRL